MTTSLTSVAMTTSPVSFADADLFARVAANLAGINERISAAGRDSAGVRVVAVTKTFGPEAARAALAAGIGALGENYVDELEQKRAVLAGLHVRWHYLGHLQTNKIARVLKNADLICGVSRAREVEKIAALKPGASIYVQVDFTGAAGRNGATPSVARELVRHGLASGLDVRGLMTVAPVDSGDAARAFARTREMVDELALVECSMGMSDDLELACEHGTSEVRVGRALFGSRVSAPRA